MARIWQPVFQQSAPAPDEGDPDAAAFSLMAEIVGGSATILEQTLKSAEDHL